MHFKYGGLTNDVTGNFKLDVLKREFTSIILGGPCDMIVYLMDWEVNFFFCKVDPLNLFHEFIVGSHRIMMEQTLRRKLRKFKVVVFPLLFIKVCCGTQLPIERGQTTKLHP